MAQGSDDSRFLAEIPWIKRPVGDKRLENTNFYKQIGEKCPLEEKIKRLQLFWLLNETFPFYLPQRYHAMDCLALHKNSKDGNYWANTTVFLFNGAAYGHRFLADVNDFLKCGEPDLKTLSKCSSIYKAIKQKYLKGNLEECESAAEFLLNPWVLLQLPLEPMIMYQWAVALLAEAFKFEKDIHQIAYLACQKQLTVPIQKLAAMHYKMAQLAEVYIAIFYNYTYLGQRANYQVYFQEYHNFLIKKYIDFLPIIDFVLSQQCKDVIKALKRLAFKSFTNKKERLIFQLNTPRKHIPCPFSSYNLFWNCKDKLTNLKPPHVKVNDENCHKFEELQVSEQHLKQFVDDVVGQTNILKGASKEDNLAAMSSVTDALPQFGQLLSLRALLDGYTSAQKTGIIYNMNTLHMEAIQAELLTRLTSDLGSVLETYRQEIMKDVHCHVEEYNLRQVSEIISKVQPDQKWSYKNILKRVKDSFNEKLMEFPDFEQGAEKIALHLQERIRRVVLKMIERQYDSYKADNFMHYPECQFVQLILPCFVASFLDLDKDPLTSKETKKMYFDFLNELVKSYETTEYSNKIILPKDAMPFACAIHNCFQTPHLQDRCESVEKVLHYMLPNSKICDEFVSKGMSFNFYVDTMDESENDEYFMKNTPWTHLVFMFNSRIRSVIRKMGFPDDPEMILCEIDYFIQPNDMEKVSIEQRLILKIHKWLKVYVGRCPPEMVKKEALNLLNDGVTFEMIEEAQAISEQNVDGLVLYLWVKYIAEDRMQFFTSLAIQKPGFPLDSLVSALWFYVTNNILKFKLQVANIFTMREDNDDLSLVPFDVAKSNWCYQTILKFISPEGKVQMSRPGEITFFPVKHCRWCGQVKVKEFRVCPVCAETPEYPDLNLYCSEKCEKEALEKQHEEEHVNFLMEQCGIDS